MTGVEQVERGLQAGDPTDERAPEGAYLCPFMGPRPALMREPAR